MQFLVGGWKVFAYGGEFSRAGMEVPVLERLGSGWNLSLHRWFEDKALGDIFVYMGRVKNDVAGTAK